MDKVLIIDDLSTIRKIYKNILEQHEIECYEATNGKEALNFLYNNIGLISCFILDQEMPIMNGSTFLEIIKSNKDFNEIPVIFVSSETDSKFIKKILAFDVYDFLVKPLDSEILYLKVKNALSSYHRELFLKKLNSYIVHKNEELELIVKERTTQLNEMLFALINTLENANYYNDNDTGNHIHRVAKYSELIATKYGLPSTTVNNIKIFAPLHDIGKVAVSDEILKKPGKLTIKEFEIMKTHVLIGYEMIKNAPIPEIAKNIIKYHHEKWNKKGYPEGLGGEEIPIEARIVAISDVFDALISSRVYKEPYSIETIISILIEERGESFQEELVDIILENIEEMQEINNLLK